ncbi:MAG TPA: pyruvate, phosphate dikinase, partial [Rhodobacteraceae bacterium]|nr:pyruvate, phosphate dikinase [Paracoccaceae bacterium]
GGKGANLAEMCNLGLPVPLGFTITTKACIDFYDNDSKLPDDVWPQVETSLEKLAEVTGNRFNDVDNPLLVSVRSGARASMPGMMDTVLNLGLNDATVEGLARKANDARFAYDSYRRFIQMYADVVMGLSHSRFEEILSAFKEAKGYTYDTDLNADDWREIIVSYKACVEDELGHPFPQDPTEQLRGAVEAVFGSWHNARARTYRALHDIPDDWGTAVNVQVMVFGNMGENSATGVAFTRNPATGEKQLYGEFLVNAQGEDVVAGIRTPQSITEAARKASGSKMPSFESLMPEPYAELVAICGKLEGHFRDMQDLEFTVQDGKLWMLQTRNGKRTAEAAIHIAVDMAEEGLISREDALMRIDPASLDQLLHPTLDPDAPRQVIATGLPASPGAASGEIVFTADEAEELTTAGHEVILVREETSPEDIHGMHAARGIVTSRGGMTSHAAVVARGMGTPCVSGAGGLKINMDAQSLTAGGTTLVKGDILTIDGGTGEIIAGKVATRSPQLSGAFATLMGWADEVRRMKVRANAETPEDARTAREFGASGIGLCRTEHMFFDAERILVVREMILAADEAGRREALEQLLPVQRQDFTDLFTIMAGLPVTIRLLDPPLHEFLPHEDKDIAEVAEAMKINESELRGRVAELKEFNPMLGHRGCRLAISYPEIAEMQARAILEAAHAAGKATGTHVRPEIMVPLVASRTEFDYVRAVIDKVAEEVAREYGSTIDYHVGTMIELPRAALMAGDIARSAEFFSFGTNDLTQTTYGLSRDDSSKFLIEYVKKGIFPADPFQTLDREGVGELVRLAAQRGRGTRKDIKLGICGEHGGDPASIAFCEEAGLDYVSCSPFRIPIARLAAAQAAIGGQSTDRTA